MFLMVSKTVPYSKILIVGYLVAKCKLAANYWKSYFLEK